MVRSRLSKANSVETPSQVEKKANRVFDTFYLLALRIFCFP